ncbi:hypothetical protein JKY72_04545, partial [Candidatus Gracilibacteria bacterium]|nr:hypothetical protein [Candidatus Gracilibacteria bacterium]
MKLQLAAILVAIMAVPLSAQGIAFGPPAAWDLDSDDADQYQEVERYEHGEAVILVSNKLLAKLCMEWQEACVITTPRFNTILVLPGEYASKSKPPYINGMTETEATATPPYADPYIHGMRETEPNTYPYINGVLDPMHRHRYPGSDQYIQADPPPTSGQPVLTKKDEEREVILQLLAIAMKQGGNIESIQDALEVHLPDLGLDPKDPRVLRHFGLKVKTPQGSPTIIQADPPPVRPQRSSASF